MSVANATDSAFSVKTSAREAAKICANVRGRDFADKVVLITGANSGIGQEAAIGIAAAGATVVVVCRSQAKADEAAALIAKSAKVEPSKVIPGVLDCSSLKSVHEFAAKFNAGDVVPSKQLNVLINNAGIMQLPKYQTSADGYEMQFAVNFLAGYALAEALMPCLKASATADEPSRVVNVSSSAHTLLKFERLSVDKIPISKAEYMSFQEYSVSKAMQIVHAQHINATLGSDPDHPVIARALHPGVIQTKLGRSAATFSLTWWLYAFPRVALLLGFHKTLEAGAGPSVRLALDPRLTSPTAPVYFNDNCNPKDPRLPRDVEERREPLMQKAASLVSQAPGAQAE